MATTRHKPRPYKPADERKTVVIPLRVTKEQHALFLRAATAKRVRVSHWLRDAGESVAKKELDE